MAKRTGRTFIRTNEWCTYLFEISASRFSYSFDDGSRFHQTAFQEHLHPFVEAVCVAPAKLAGRHTDFTIIGDRQHEHDLWMQKPALPNETGIGTLSMRGQRSTYLGSLPYDATWRLAPLITLKAVRFIYLHGAALYRGTARITSMHFYESFNLDDI